jgi:hypothetical protein
MPKLKKGGKVLFVHKVGDKEEADFRGEFEVSGCIISQNRKEIYYLLSNDYNYHY